MGMGVNDQSLRLMIGIDSASHVVCAIGEHSKIPDRFLEIHLVDCSGNPVKMFIPEADFGPRCPHCFHKLEIHRGGESHEECEYTWGVGNKCSCSTTGYTE